MLDEPTSGPRHAGAARVSGKHGRPRRRGPHGAASRAIRSAKWSAWPTSWRSSAPAACCGRAARRTEADHAAKLTVTVQARAAAAALPAKRCCTSDARPSVAGARAWSRGCRRSNRYDGRRRRRGRESHAVAGGDFRGVHAVWEADAAESALTRRCAGFDDVTFVSNYRERFPVGVPLAVPVPTSRSEDTGKASGTRHGLTVFNHELTRSSYTTGPTGRRGRSCGG